MKAKHFEKLVSKEEYESFKAVMLSSEDKAKRADYEQFFKNFVELNKKHGIGSKQDVLAVMLPMAMLDGDEGYSVVNFILSEADDFQVILADSKIAGALCQLLRGPYSSEFENLFKSFIQDHAHSPKLHTKSQLGLFAGAMLDKAEVSAALIDQFLSPCLTESDIESIELLATAENGGYNPILGESF